MDSFEPLSGFYDLDYPDTSDHVFLKQLVSAVDPGHLLEIPCGSGRNVAPLLESASRNVTFMDIAETMVNETNRRIPESERERAKAVVGDMRSLGTIGELDLVICPREAFQLLNHSEAAQALSSMAASIASDGLIVIDLFNFTRDPASRSDAPPDYFSPKDHGWVEDWTRTTADRSLTVTRRRRQSFTTDGVHFEMRYTLRTPAEPKTRSVDLAFDMTNHSRDGFRQLTNQSGLDVLATFAGYGDAPTIASRSLRTVFVLGHDRHQKGGERLNRIRNEIATDR
jgi:SAM-dependent methyltransferase